MRRCFYYINMKFKVSWDPFLLTRVSVVFGDHGKPFLTHPRKRWSKRQVTSVPSRKQKEIRSKSSRFRITTKKVINLVTFDYHTNTSTSIPLLFSIQGYNTVNAPDVANKEKMQNIRPNALRHFTIFKKQEWMREWKWEVGSFFPRCSPQDEYRHEAFKSSKNNSKFPRDFKAFSEEERHSIWRGRHLWGTQKQTHLHFKSHKQ